MAGDRQRYLPLLVLALSLVSGFALMGSFSTVQEAAKAELSLSDYALSSIQGLATAIPLALFSIPIGIIVDRWNRVRLLAVLSALWIAGTLLTAWAPNGPTLFVARMLVGIGTTGGLTAALSLTADFARPDLRGRAMLIVNMGKTIGVAAAFSITGALTGSMIGWADLTAWRGAHVLLAAGATILLVPVLLLREPARREVEATSNPSASVLWAELRARRSFLIPLFAGQTSVVMADTAALIWAAPILSRDFHLTPQEFGGWMGALILATGIAGTVAGGILADWGHRTGIRGGLLIGMVAAAAVGVPAALFPMASNVTLFALGLGTLAFGGSITGLIMGVALTVYLPNELRGLTIGFFIAVAGLVGFGLAPTLVVVASDMLGGEDHLAEGLAAVGLAVGLIAVAGIAAAMRHAPIEGAPDC